MAVTVKMPKERFSPIDYFLEEVDMLEEFMGKVTGVILTASSYERMKQDPYIYQDTSEKRKSERLMLIDGKINVFDEESVK